jgi:hypothetical protein
VLNWFSAKKLSMKSGARSVSYVYSHSSHTHILQKSSKNFSSLGLYFLPLKLFATMKASPTDIEQQFGAIAEYGSVDMVDNILNELETKLSVMEERDGGVMERQDVETRSVHTTRTEKGGDLNAAQRKYVRDMVTAAMVKQIMTRRLEGRKVPEIMKMSRKVEVDLAPKMKNIVDRLADATAKNVNLQGQIQAIALLGGLDDEDIPSHEMLYQLAREDIARKLKHCSMKNVKRAEQELSVSLEDCRDGIIESLCVGNKA